MTTLHTTSALSFTFAAALALAGCSGATTDAPAEPTETSASATPSAAAITPTPASSVEAQVLTLEGLGGLIIGQPVPQGSSFVSRGAQIGNGCEILSSPDYPNTYAMVEEGTVRRITLTTGAKARLVEGIGPGASAKEVKAAFPGFVESPHKYTGPEGKYLTQPGKDPRLIFEISPEGRVTDVHVGMMPQLGYVEGCA